MKEANSIILVDKDSLPEIIKRSSYKQLLYTWVACTEHRGIHSIIRGVGEIDGVHVEIVIKAKGHGPHESHVGNVGREEKHLRAISYSMPKLLKWTNTAIDQKGIPPNQWYYGDDLDK